MLQLLSPAKVNLTLEVLGRRPDGYHEIATVMQAIDLADRVRLENADGIELEVAGERQGDVPIEGPRNLAYAAAEALQRRAGRHGIGARIVLDKQIPAGMGLGGGSSNAAAVLRGLNSLWGLGLATAALEEVAAGIGSDVAFFLHGGAAVATGRGERVEPLPDHAPFDLTVFLPPVAIEDKTRRMYAALTPACYSDGHATRVAADTLRRDLPLNDEDQVNAFDAYLAEVAPPAAAAFRACRDAGLAVHATGSGPGFYCLTPLEQLPSLLLRRLEREWGVTAVACRSLDREASLALREV